MTRGYENNDIDVWLSNRLQKYSLFRIRDHKKALWTPIIEKFVLTLSDQQLLVGIAILIAGFAQHCSISVYHFSIVTDLAWFSSNTHLVTLDVLRVYLAGEPTLRLWRICLMLGTVVLLIVGVIFEGHRAWYDSWYSDAQCLFDDLRGNVGGLPAKWMAINIVLIVYNYTTSIFGLLQKSWEGDIVDRTLEVWYNNLQKQKIALAKKKDLGLTASYAAQLGAYSISFCFLFFCTALSTILGSLTVSLLINVGWFAVGLWSIVEDRSVSPSDIDGDENRWAFGQIVPVLLLSSAVFTLKELHSGDNPTSLYDIWKDD